MPLKLFVDLLTGDWFHFGDKPERKLLKSDQNHYISPEGRRAANKHVAIFSDVIRVKRKSIYDQTKDDLDGQ